jgi:hypothetical protein
MQINSGNYPIGGPMNFSVPTSSYGGGNSNSNFQSQGGRMIPNMSNINTPNMSNINTPIPYQQGHSPNEYGIMGQFNNPLLPPQTNIFYCKVCHVLL